MGTGIPGEGYRGGRYTRVGGVGIPGGGCV